MLADAIVTLVLTAQTGRPPICSSLRRSFLNSVIHYRDWPVSGAVRPASSALPQKGHELLRRPE